MRFVNLPNLVPPPADVRLGPTIVERFCLPDTSRFEAGFHQVLVKLVHDAVVIDIRIGHRAEVAGHTPRQATVGGIAQQNAGKSDAEINAEFERTKSNILIVAI